MRPPHRLQIVPAARRQLRQLPRPAQHRVRLVIRGLAVEPRPAGSKLLSGPARIWRLRLGDYRILYDIQDDLVLVVVIRVGNRSRSVDDSALRERIVAIVDALVRA